MIREDIKDREIIKDKKKEIAQEKNRNYMINKGKEICKNKNKDKETD